MNDRERFDDDDVRGIATAAFHDHERSVSPDETEAALGAVRARLAAGDTGGSSPTFTPAGVGDHRRSPWIVLGAVAAVIGLLALGLVAVVGDRDGDTIVPATDPSVVVAEPSSPPTEPGTPPPTGPAPTEPTPDGTNPAVVVPERSVPATATASTPPPSSTLPPLDPQPGEALAIPNRCASDVVCTQLTNAEDDRIVSYDPVDEALRIYDPSGSNVLSETTLGEPVADAQPFVEHVGSDDVAYVSIATPGAGDPSRDLLAIPTSGPNAGAVVMRWTRLDGSGDSSLIARKAGLSSVPCCGPRVARPDPDAPLYRYVDRNGEIVESTAPTFRFDLGEVGNNLVRIEEDGSQTFFDLPTVFQYPRDIPRLVATDDGGALATDYVQPGDLTVIVRFRTDWPESGIDNSDVFFVEDPESTRPLLFERSGTVVMPDGDGFVRVDLDDIATPGWPGTVEIADTAGRVDAPGLNEYVAASQPFWAGDPTLFAYQLKQSVDQNESVLFEFDDASGVLTITTDGSGDNSTDGDRITVRTERADDGLLRFVSGTYGFTCQPGRGHQDFSTEPCR